ncbi:DUF5616 domain-containing protein [Anaerocolumna xylanovorans]|uniref:DUF5616 domain-containing protein n=1 Tax=Anaerocolumna xylanovorans TaxID=100134 RepID=UPI002E8E2411|nr:DUF5616 domain-containing protein [Anaerocolumna xylanovorans]
MKAVLYLDAQVLNSDRLSMLINEELAKHSFITGVYCINEVDKTLKGMECMVTADCAILEQI